MAKVKREKKLIDRSSWRTTKKERRNFYIGDIGRVCSGSIVTTFMTMFLMFQGIDLTYVAGVLLAVKIVDSVNDVLFGYLIDKLKIKEWKIFKKITGEGKYLPWFRLFFPLFPIFTIVFFLMPAGLPLVGKLVWFAVFHLLYDFAYTVVEVPMNSILVTLTDNQDERNTIIQTKTILSGLTTFIIPMIWLVLVSQQVGLPLVWVACVSTVIFFFMMLPITRGVKEHNTELANAGTENEHYSFKDMLKCVKSNKYLLILLLSSFFSTALATSGGSIGLFASFYIFGNELIMILPILISFPLVIAGQFLTSRLTKRFGKVKVLLIGGLIGAAGFLGIYFVGLGGITNALATIDTDTIVNLGLSTGFVVVLCALLVLQAAPGNVSTMVRGFLLPDTIEYARYTTGKDCSGICTALNAFVTKLTTAFSSSIGLFILGLSGWVPIEATDFADLAAQSVGQPVSTLNMLWMLYALIPTIGMLLSVLVMAFYRLKDRDIELMTKCNSGKITREECESRLSRSYGKKFNRPVLAEGSEETEVEADISG